jgi:tetratricopeptide (TPR) repeat protein
VPDYRSHLATVRLNLGVVLTVTGRRAEAETEFQKGLAINERLVEDFPSNTAFRFNLGQGCLNFGRVWVPREKPADQIEWFGKAISALRPLVEQDPRDARAKLFLRDSHFHRAIAHDQAWKPAEAVKDWDKAIELSPPEDRLTFRVFRVTSLANAGRLEGAVAELADLRKLTGYPPDVFVGFARVYAVAAGKVSDEQKNYADRAVEMLQKAVKAGLKDAAKLKADKDFDPLRERDDFKKLLTDLDKK